MTTYRVWSRPSAQGDWQLRFHSTDEATAARFYLGFKANKGQICISTGSLDEWYQRKTYTPGTKEPFVETNEAVPSIDLSLEDTGRRQSVDSADPQDVEVRELPDT